MSTLAEVYASAPAGSLIISTLEINVAGQPPIRICDGFENHLLGVSGSFVQFEAGSLSVSLPAKNNTGRQTLNFGVAGVSAMVDRYFDLAEESGQPVQVVYREYLESDKSQPARKPYVMELLGGTIEGDEATLSAAFFDLLNLRWSRQLYTATNAPGIKYL